MVKQDLVLQAESLEALGEMPDGFFQMVYIDPPFNTGKTQRLHGKSYEDKFDDYIDFLEPFLQEGRRILRSDGTMYVQLDSREVHYVKVCLDGIYGRECFLNEIIWAYDFGNKPKDKWPRKHNTILVYVKDPNGYYFDNEEVERIPYMAPSLVLSNYGQDHVDRGKMPTDVWWHTTISPTAHERTGYPTQKPMGVVRRMVQASTKEGDWVIDFFAGSGTLGAVAQQLGRRFVLIDKNPDAFDVMVERLDHSDGLVFDRRNHGEQ